MKIGIFSNTYYPHLNGVATSIVHFSQALRKQGHTTYIFVPKVRNYQDKDKNIFRIPAFKAPLLPDIVKLPVLLPHKSFKEMIAKDYDLVHAHENGLFGLLGLLTARIKRIPFILTYHTQMSDYAHYFLKGKVIKPKHINYIFLKKFGGVCDLIIAPSAKMKDELIEMGVKKRIEIVPNFIDFSRFDNLKNEGFLRKKYSLGEDTPILLAVGRLGKEKNFEFLIKVFSNLLKTTDTKAHLIIVGEGVDKDKLQSLIKKLKLQNRAHLTGGIPWDKMPLAYKDATLFVFPSTSEIHPMVTIEAAYAGLPLIVAKDKAYKGVVEDSINGFMLDLKPQAFIDKIELLLNDKALYKKYSQNSKKIVQKNFSPAVITKRLISLYKQAISDYKTPVKPIIPPEAISPLVK